MKTNLLQTIRKKTKHWQQKRGINQIKLVLINNYLGIVCENNKIFFENTLRLWDHLLLYKRLVFIKFDFHNIFLILSMNSIHFHYDYYSLKHLVLFWFSQIQWNLYISNSLYKMNSKFLFLSSIIKNVLCESNFSLTRASFPSGLEI